MYNNKLTLEHNTMNLNKVFILGNVTRDPETRTTPSGAMVANFGIATNRFWKDAAGERQSKADFHNIVAWRGLAELVQQYVNKGSLILIEGRIETRSWDDPSGAKHYRTEVIADAIQLGPRNASRAGGSPGSVSDQQSAQTPPPPKEDEIPTIDVNIDDVPF